jgi:hypothetical protein
METHAVSGTSHPIWGAHFLFELSDLPRDDVLIVVREREREIRPWALRCNLRERARAAPRQESGASW